MFCSPASCSGVAYLRTKALWLPIGIHFGWNGLQGPVLGINVTGTDPGGPWHAFSFQGADLWTGGTMGIEGGLAGLAGPLVGIALVVFLFRRRENEARRLGGPIPT
jgi:membrane protease YdiL (CAAX protease family)